MASLVLALAPPGFPSSGLFYLFIYLFLALKVLSSRGLKY